MERAEAVAGKKAAQPREKRDMGRAFFIWGAPSILQFSGLTSDFSAKIPYGSKILLGDEELIAVDTGPAVVNRKAARLSGRNEAERNAVVIDRYFEMKSQAVAWGKSHPHFMKVRVLSPRPALAIAEKGEPKHRNLPSQPIVATQRISRPPVRRPAIPVGDFYFRALFASSRTTTRDARRRTGGEFVAGNLVERSRGRPLDRFRLLQIT